MIPLIASCSSIDNVFVIPDNNDIVDVFDFVFETTSRLGPSSSLLNSFSLAA